MTESGVHFQGANAEHLTPHNSYFHGLLHTPGYSFNLSGSWGEEKWFAHPQSSLKKLWQECRASGSQPAFGCHIQGLSWMDAGNQSVWHIGSGLVWETKLEQSHEPLLTWTEMQEGNTDFKGPLYHYVAKQAKRNPIVTVNVASRVNGPAGSQALFASC